MSQDPLVFQNLEIGNKEGREFQPAGPHKDPQWEPESQVAFREKVWEMKVREEKERNDYAEGEEKLSPKRLTAAQAGSRGQPEAHPQEDQAAASHGKGAAPEESLETLGS